MSASINLRFGSSLSAALATSRQVGKAKTVGAPVVKKSGNDRVDFVNSMAHTRVGEDSDAVARMAKASAAEATGAGSAAANPTPTKVDATGRVTGDMRDPKIGEGRVTPLRYATTADGGKQSIFDFFASRTPYGGAR